MMALKPATIVLGLLATVFHTVHAQPVLTVADCVENTKGSMLRVPGRMRDAPYMETVTLTGAQPNKPVYLAYHKEDYTTTKKRDFKKGCGLVAGDSGSATSMIMNLFRLTKSREMEKTADNNGEATFEIGTGRCGKNFYQAYDWINNKNCEQSEVVGGTTSQGCSECTHFMWFGDFLANRDSGGSHRATKLPHGVKCHVGPAPDWEDYDGDYLMAVDGDYGQQSTSPDAEYMAEPDTCIMSTLEDATDPKIASSGYMGNGEVWDRVCVKTSVPTKNRHLCGPSAAFD